MNRVDKEKDLIELKPIKCSKCGIEFKPLEPILFYCMEDKCPQQRKVAF